MEQKERIKKSALAAEGNYDIHKLGYPQRGFLNCTIEEEKEELVFTFEIGQKNPFINLRTEKKQDKLSALIDAAELQNIYQDYFFQLNDSNLYYDRNCRVYVKNRDLYERGIQSDQEQFLLSYKALIGCIMQNKYSYMDYWEGGMELLNKNKFLKQIYACQSLEETKECLEKAYAETVELIRNQKVLVDKSWYRTSKWSFLISLLIILAGGIYLGFLTLDILPRQQSMLKANNAYLDTDYIQVIDSLKKVNMQYLDQHQKYMLAVSYIKSENLTPDQKTSILEQIHITSDEKVKEYWIYLGRLEVDEAINIALQINDDELLLYAYLTKKTILEKNTTLPGEEKTQLLTELEQKINQLAKKYEKEE